MVRVERQIQNAKHKSQKAKPRPATLLPFAFCTLSFTCSGRRQPSSHHFLPTAYCLLLTAFCLLVVGCKVGPNYQRPPVATPSAYKELPPDNSAQASEWKTAQPSDAIARGKWWEIYNDSELNGLEEQVSISNQSLKTAEAQFREAKFAVKIARAALYPTFTVAPTLIDSRTSSNLSNSNNSNFGKMTTIYDLPVDASWEADTWGSVRRSITSSAAAAQFSDAQLEGARLSYEAELAQDYFGLRGTDGERQLLETTVKSYQDYLKLTQDRFNERRGVRFGRRTGADATGDGPRPVN